MLNVVGVALNVIGLALTLYGIVREARERGAALLSERERAAVVGVRRALGMGGKTHQVSASVSTTWSVEAVGSVVPQTARSQDDPLDKQLETMEKNFDAKLEGLRSQLDAYDARHVRRVGGLRQDHAGLVEKIAQTSRDDVAIASHSLRIEVFGVALALLGTSISVFG